MEELIQRAKQGDQLAIAEIFDNYKELVRSIANKFYLVGGDKDDLLQEGMMGLFFAINNFDENKGSFPAFVKLCVLRQIIDAVKKDGAEKNRALGNYLDISLAENISDGTTPIEKLLEKEVSEHIAQIIAEKLTPTERKVINLFMEGYSYEDIANKLQVSYKAVDGALQRARKKLLLYLTEN